MLSIIDVPGAGRIRFSGAYSLIRNLRGARWHLAPLVVLSCSEPRPLLIPLEGVKYLRTRFQIIGDSRRLCAGIEQRLDCGNIVAGIPVPTVFRAVKH